MHIMRILTSNHYIGNFTVPPQMGHSIERARFVNLGRLWGPALAVAAYSPVRRFDLAHFVNRIPLALHKPWLVTFESALPRMFPPTEPLRRHLRHQLCSPDCLAIVAMSQWALASFQRINTGWAGLEKVLAKTQVLQPAVPLGTRIPRTLKSNETIRLIFVGNNFARKGGIVALRLAKQALAEGLRLQIHIVSSKMICSGSHTDHPDPSRYQTDLQGLALPNVIFHGAMNNQQVLELMGTCHLNFLPTLHDTYGFSVLEGFANGLPALTTDICALPEFVFPGLGANANGFLLHLPKDGRNCWSHVEESGSPDYWDKLDHAFGSMTDQAMVHLRALAAAPGQLEQLSVAAVEGIEQRHNQSLLATALDAIYTQSTPIRARARLWAGKDRVSTSPGRHFG
jgi:glycosyltransferase involved in cell wall biosynthesis